MQSLIRHRHLIFDMWRTELKRRYAGTLLGPVWAVAPQALTVVAYWFVFEIGLKIKGSGPLPYFYYFALGILPWFLFFDAFSTSATAVRDNQHLITKIVFPSEILPIVAFLVASVPHVVIVTILAGILWKQQILSTGNLPWLLYFYLCTAVLAVGVGWLVGAITVFLKDLAHFTQLVVSLLFWVTPIMWQVTALPESWHPAFEWNPLSYVVEGYRFSLADGAPPAWGATLKFWCITLVIGEIGRRVFLQLKHHFADVL